MKKKNLLLSAMLSTLLLTTNISAQQIECKDGKCFINLSKIASAKKSSTKVKNFKVRKVSPLTVAKQMGLKTIQPAGEPNNLEIIAFDHSTYVMQENEQLELDDGMDTIVLSPSKYIMSKSELEKYYHATEEERINIEDKIIEKSTLPVSEYYCNNDKKAVYNQELKTYQCII